MYDKYKELRDSRKITDYRVSKDTGIPVSCLCDWGKGRYVPKVDKMLVLAEYFGVPLEELVKA